MRFPAPGAAAAGAHEVNRPIEWTRAADLAAFDAFGVGDADFTHIADANEGGDAVIEQDLALIPDEVVERIPKAGKNELAVRVDDLRVGLGVLSLPSDTPRCDCLESQSEHHEREARHCRRSTRRHQ